MRGRVSNCEGHAEDGVSRRKLLQWQVGMVMAHVMHVCVTLDLH